MIIEWEVEANGMLDLDDPRKEWTQKEQADYVKKIMYDLVMDDQQFWILKVNGERV